MSQEKKSRVVLLPCKEYDEEKIYGLLKQGLELAGPVCDLWDPKEKILIKPNLLKKSDIDQAVITHPAVIGALLRILKEEGCGDIFLADSCGHGKTSDVILGTGIDTCLKKYQVPAIDYSEGVRTKWQDGVQAKEFILPKELLAADCVISVCKMKTHALERITGAVKNSYGFIYGKNKALGHTHYPSADSFARMLIDLNRCVHPRIYIMDGIVAMEGNGPGSGDPVAMNVMLLSRDPVALDGVFANLVDLDPKIVPTCYHGEKMGLGTWKEEEIEILLPDGSKISMSETIRRYGNPSFNVDRSGSQKNMWTALSKAGNLFQKKPRIIEEKCVHCGICVESCPVEGKAVDFRNGRNHPPTYDYKKCIRCFCCQEMCPQKAIEVR